MVKTKTISIETPADETVENIATIGDLSHYMETRTSLCSPGALVFGFNRLSKTEEKLLNDVFTDLGGQAFDTASSADYSFQKIAEEPLSDLLANHRHTPAYHFTDMSALSGLRHHQEVAPLLKRVDDMFIDFKIMHGDLDQEKLLAEANHFLYLQKGGAARLQ